MAGPAITARLRHSWSDRLLQVEDLRPKNSAAVLLEWEVEGGSVDSGVPARLAGAIATALVRLGSVAFRWAGDCPWSTDQATVIRAPKYGVIRAAVDHITGRWQSDIVITRQASVAVAMFEHGWELQDQAALVLDIFRDFDDEIRVDLATRLNWGDFKFTTRTSIFLAPAVDGDGVLLAARSNRDLMHMTDALGAALINGNIPFEDMP